MDYVHVFIQVQYTDINDFAILLLISQELGVESS